MIKITKTVDFGWKTENVTMRFEDVDHFKQQLSKEILSMHRAFLLIVDEGDIENVYLGNDEDRDYGWEWYSKDDDFVYSYWVRVIGANDDLMKEVA